MKYTKKQHVLSQWVLRNFRSDDTASEPKGKQRVWCHIINLLDDSKNDIKEIPLLISSIAVQKDCFMLSESGVKFDIEEELSDYERNTSILFNELVHKHKFQQLLDVSRNGSALEVILNFMVIQMILGAFNPQNKMAKKEDALEAHILDMVENYNSISELILSPPSHVKPFYEHRIFKKMLRVIRSDSAEYNKCKALFFLSMLAEAKNLPAPLGDLSRIRESMYSGIHITGIYHTGYDFDSTELRPVFTISPNVVMLNQNNNFNLLPLSHNLAIGFSVGQVQSYNTSLNIFSVYPDKLKCRSSKKLRLYRVSHDYIDSISGWINLIAVNNSNAIYTPYELKDVQRYLKHQNENYDYHYLPEHPVLVEK